MPFWILTTIDIDDEDNVEVRVFIFMVIFSLSDGVIAIIALLL